MAAVTTYLSFEMGHDVARKLLENLHSVGAQASVTMDLVFGWTSCVSVECYL